MEINLLLREGMEMFVCTTTEMEWEWEYGNENGRDGIEKFIPAYLYTWWMW